MKSPWTQTKYDEQSAGSFRNSPSLHGTFGAAGTVVPVVVSLVAVKS